MYADDLPIYAIYATIDNKEDYIKLLYELHELCKWASDKCLSINYNKCKVINFRRTNKNFVFQINNTLSKTSNAEKISSVIIEPDLNFS